jgi:hypothetical protein
VNAGDQARSPREGEHDPLHRGDLPPLAAREGAPNLGPAHAGAQGRGDEDHAVQKKTRIGQHMRFKAFIIGGDNNGHVGLGSSAQRRWRHHLLLKL